VKRTIPWTDWNGPVLNFTRSQSLHRQADLQLRRRPTEHTSAGRRGSSRSVTPTGVGPVRGCGSDQIRRDLPAGDDRTRTRFSLSRATTPRGVVERRGAETAAQVGHAIPRASARGPCQAISARAAKTVEPTPRPRAIPDRRPRLRFTTRGQQRVLLLIAIQAVVGQVSLRVAGRSRDPVSARVRTRREG